jgi:hypothetical protein
MPMPKELREEMAQRHASYARAAERDKRHDLAKTALLCICWSLLGILCILWSASTTSLVHGKIAFWGGLAIGNGGVIFTLLAAYARGERRGDW